MKPLAKLIGQPLAIELLERAIAKNHVAPAYLFVGADGIGKAFAAKCFTEMLMIDETENYLQACKKLYAGNHPDFLWVEPTYNDKGVLLTATDAIEKGFKRKTSPKIRIEQIREISQFLARPPLKCDRSVVVIESAELMAESAGNALLKTLEEPGQATIILIAPSIDSILSTLVSRCQIIPFSRLSEEHLKLVLYREDAAQVLDYPQLIKLSQGCPGKAISDWQKLREIPSDLLLQLTKLPDNVIDGLNLAKQISKDIELENQIWLADYLQYLYWDKERKINIIEALEKVKKFLSRYIQPRLVWDCFFLDII
ncbi:DNA polymerase III delta prime subunit [Geminocystis sp. NIES-3708]|uniref:DNA polymerase III subunit delta' n=1 Tax=Geminocystis sp. NIES-3708 TaxID=1615909 RepID=UPI0005FC4495|nr:DNA polymerase III subunit delta' [Geminocystis sp. NIES-3708]BAQ62086.1 DNA polymerase III delta prime subunit [Geminocystis sp. NIES-3708]